MKTVLVLLLSLCAGCATYVHKVVNTGNQMLYAVTVESDGTKFGYGYLPAAAVKGYHGSKKIRQSPPPIISWCTEERGQMTSKEATLDKNPSWRQEVIFEIDGSNVVVRMKMR